MTVAELIKHLQALPQEKHVAVFWDGAARGRVEGIVNDDAEVVIVGDWSVFRPEITHIVCNRKKSRPRRSVKVCEQCQHNKKCKDWHNYKQKKLL